ncbi:MAG TPA: hypothetical protein PK246_09090 [Saprospiraceae bacterium]|nr:hypothetical protein [Lewinellaceae bacterium]HPK10474.1 hypothetical protein [Saprospiraceae bacterium]
MEIKHVSIKGKVTRNKIESLLAKFLNLSLNQIGDYITDIENDNILVGVELKYLEEYYNSYINIWIKRNIVDFCFNLQLANYLNIELKEEILVENDIFTNSYEFIVCKKEGIMTLMNLD